LRHNGSIYVVSCAKADRATVASAVAFLHQEGGVQWTMLRPEFCLALG